MTTARIESLELQALDQRRRLHRSASDLRSKIAEARESLDISKQARAHLAKASVVVSVLGLLAGYGLAGLFTRH